MINVLDFGAKGDGITADRFIIESVGGVYCYLSVHNRHNKDGGSDCKQNSGN